MVNKSISADINGATFGTFGGMRVIFGIEDGSGGTGGGAAMFVGKFATKLPSFRSLLGRCGSKLDRCSSLGRTDGTAFLSNA